MDANHETGPARPVKGEVNPVQHYTGSRPTRVTWSARVLMSDDTYRDCGHHMHPKSANAATCCRKLIKAIQAEIAQAES